MNSIWQDIRNAFGPAGSALIRLITMNVAVFAVIAIVGVVGFFAGMAFEDVLLSYLQLPASFGQWIYRPWTLVSYFFTHQDPFHILFNMLFLYWFGQIVQEYLGNRRLLTIYFLGGIAGGLLYMAAYTFIPVFQPYLYVAVLIGASGACYAVVTAAATLTPNYTFYLLLLGPVRIVYIALFYIALSFISIRSGNPGGNIAHLGGALLGFLYIKGLRSGTDLGGWFWNLWDSISAPRGGKMKVSHRGSGGGSKSTSKKVREGNSSQDEIDAILDKINKVGYENLTREEKEKLYSAGQENQ